jgi:hypothetical protein
LARLIRHQLQLDRIAPGRFDGGRRVRIELPFPLPADDQIPIAFGAQPGQMLFRRQPAVHHDQGTLGCPQTFQHPGQGFPLAEVAFETFGTAHKTTAIQHQAQGHQRTIGALSLEGPRWAFGFTVASPSK